MQFVLELKRWTFNRLNTIPRICNSTASLLEFRWDIWGVQQRSTWAPDSNDGNWTTSQRVLPTAFWSGRRTGSSGRSDRFCSGPGHCYPLLCIYCNLGLCGPFRYVSFDATRARVSSRLWDQYRIKVERGSRGAQKATILGALNPNRHKIQIYDEALMLQILLSGFRIEICPRSFCFMAFRGFLIVETTMFMNTKKFQSTFDARHFLF